MKLSDVKSKIARERSNPHKFDERVKPMQKFESEPQKRQPQPHKPENESRKIEKPTKQRTKENIISSRAEPRDTYSVLSSDARQLMTNGKYKVVGSVNCGYCKQQRKIIDGQFVAMDVEIVGKEKNGVINDIEIIKANKWEDYHDSLNDNKKSFEKLKEIHTSMGKVSVKIPQKIQQNMDKLAKLKDTLKNTPDKGKKDGIKNTMKELNQQTNDMLRFQDKFQEVVETFNDVKHAYKMNKVMVDPRIDFDNVRKKFQFLYVDDHTPQSKVAKEIADVYGLEGYPMFAKSKCDVKPIKKGSGVLSQCKEEGFKTFPLLAAFDAEQQGDIKKLKIIQKVQKELMEKD